MPGVRKRSRASGGVAAASRCSRCLGLYVAFSYLVLGTGTRVLGQTAEVYPGRERPVLPEFSEEAPAPQFQLPPVDKPAPSEAPLASQPQVFVRSFRILGNTVLAPELLAAEVQPYTERRVTAEELQQLRRRLTARYIESGYINSGVLLPDQEIADGVITLVVIEGVLSRVEVTGNRDLRPGYVRDRVSLDPEAPLRLPALEERLQLLLQDPLIGAVKGQLVPGRRLGESTLLVEVQEDRPLRVGVSVDNHRSPSVGSLQGVVHLTHLNATGNADRLDLNYGLTEGLNTYGVAYSIPVSSRDSRVALSYEQNDSVIVEEPLENLDVEGKVTTLAVSIDHPFLKTLRDTVALTVRLEKRHSESFLLEHPFSFAAGVREGESDVTVLRVGVEWFRKYRDQVIALRSIASKGIDAFGATINEDEPDSRFLTWLGQLQWARRFGENRNDVSIRLDVQLAADPLLPIEKFPVGGAASVRGYRENQFVRDNGMSAPWSCASPSHETAADARSPNSPCSPM